MNEIIIGIFKVQSDFALEVWFSICMVPTAECNGRVQLRTNMY